MGHKAETQYYVAHNALEKRVRSKQDKAHFVDKGLVDLAGHQSLGDKIETQYCVAYNALKKGLEASKTRLALWHKAR